MLPTSIIEETLEVSASPYKNYCSGYPGTGGYIVAAVMGIGAFADPCGHPASNIMDSIKAFDLAETAEAYIGQINMVTVSSFCGPGGLIWGHDVVRTERPSTHPLEGADGLDEFERVRLMAGSDLRLASKALFGTASHRLFPILPGSHVPCASKFKIARGPARIYSAFAVGIPENRANDACVLLEDVGLIEGSASQSGIDDREHILKDTVRAAVAIGKNHGTSYPEIYIDYEEKRLEEGEVGCALVTMPYIHLAQRVYNRDIATQTLEQWQRRAGTLAV